MGVMRSCPTRCRGAADGADLVIDRCRGFDLAIEHDGELAVETLGPSFGGIARRQRVETLSAGGVEALQRLVAGLTADLPAAVFVVVLMERSCD